MPHRLTEREARQVEKANESGRPRRTPIADASLKKQRRNGAVTEVDKLPGRGHSLTFDRALGFVKRFS
jgi:hypothetical protein